jgi:ribonuclease T2
MKRSTLWLIIITLSLAATGESRKHKSSAGPASFDYYLLSLSWAPTYCAEHPTDKSSECKSGNHTAFVLHGLWPSANQGQQPMSCGPASPVAARVVQHMQQYFPTKGLIQHEWVKHGTCSGLSSADYFGEVERAFKSVQVPERYRTLRQKQQLKVSEIEQDFAQANSAPTGAFRVSCHAGELVGLDACLDKDLKFQACPKSEHECPSSQVSLAPPQ